MAPAARKTSTRKGTSRPKPQLSCVTCRLRKLKCNRKHPCSNCAKENWAVCSYLSNGRSLSNDQTTSVRQEVSHTHSDLPERSVNFYINHDGFGPQLLFHGCDDMDVDELRHLIVTKLTVQALLEILASSIYARWTFILIHEPTFRQEVEQYWLDPLSCDLSWLGVFYTLLSIASHIVAHSKIVIEGLQTPDQVSYDCMVRAAQCLRRSDYAKPTNHTISAMVLYLACEHNWAKDGHFQASLVLSLTVRVALRMGYHRDPAGRSDLTLFQCEMQRRIWTFLKQLDHLIARKCNLPRLIDDRKTDTRLPQNILDNDLCPDMQILPSTCPSTLQTPIAVLNYKSGLLAIHGHITDINDYIQPVTYDRILDIDHRLTSEALNKPAWLEIDLATDPGPLDTEQMNLQVEIDLMIQSARITLHNRFLVPGHTDQRYVFSRKACLEAVLRSLDLQHLLFKACGIRDDGLKMNWRFIALVGHDFLFAALLLCLDIEQGVKIHRQSFSANPYGSANLSSLTENFTRLRMAQNAWSRFGKHHNSGQEAASMLGRVIQNLASLAQSLDWNSQHQNSESGTVSSLTDPYLPTEVVRDDLHRSFAPNNDFVSTTDVDTGLFSISDDSQRANIISQTLHPGSVPDSSFLQIQSMLENSELDFDWSTWTTGLSDTDAAYDFDPLLRL